MAQAWDGLRNQQSFGVKVFPTTTWLSGEFLRSLLGYRGSMSEPPPKPLTNELLRYCHKYRSQGGALAHAYTDLKLAQNWLDLSIIPLEDQECCVLTGRAKAGAEMRFVLPMNLEERTSMARLYKVFDALDSAPDQVTLGIVAKDSSIVYYNVQRGIVAPKEAPDAE